MSEYTGKYDVLRQGASVGNVEITKIGLLTVFECVCEYTSSEILRLCATRGGEYIPLGVMMPHGDTMRLKKSFSRNALDAMGFTAAGGFHLVGAADEAEPVIEAVEHTAQQAQAQNPALISQSPAEAKPVAAAIPQPAPAPKHQPAPAAVPAPAKPTPAVPAAAAVPAKPAPASAAKPVPSSALSSAPPHHNWQEIRDPATLFEDIDIADACRRVKGAFVLEQGDTKMLAVPISPDEPFPMMPIFCFGESETINGRNYIVFKINNGKLTV